MVRTGRVSLGARLTCFITAFLLFGIKMYRLAISPLLPRCCRFHPTCSAYAAEALQRYGLAGGGRLALRRVLRCHPFGGSGYDPVPESHRD